VPKKNKKTVTWEDEENAGDDESSRVQAPTPKSSLRKKRSRPSDLDSSEEAQAGQLLERLNLQSSPPRKKSRLVTSSERERLPTEIIDLLGLQAAFLKTLSIHYAHNGSNVPVDVCTISPSITQAWGKRKVVVEDIRRCVGLLGWKQPGEADGQGQCPFALSDYGRGKVCIELCEGVSAGILQEGKLNEVFEQNLRAIWSVRKDSDAVLFIANLPKAPVKACMSAQTNPLLSRGQKALQDLKASIAQKQQQERDAKTAAASMLSADGSKMSLLDRVRLKQHLQSQAAAPPSPAELQRRAALQRADDVAGVIGMLSMATAEGRARISFAMPAILVKLKDSLRIPISQDEGACCIRLLATDIVPQWLRVVTIGGRENVVIQTAFQPSKAVVQERVNAIMASC
jgi:hypothetical protein